MWFVCYCWWFSAYKQHNPCGDNMSTCSNQVYSIDVDSKQLHEQFIFPREFLEYPGEVIGISFPSSRSSAIVYSARAMCLIEIGNSATGSDNRELVNGLDSGLRKLEQSSIIGKLKRKWKEFDLESKVIGLENKNVYPLKDPVLFLGQLSDCSMFVDKPWIEVVKSFEAPPVHRHIYGL